MLLLCLTSTEESKPCLQLSLPTVLSSSVSQIPLLKIKSFNKSTRLLANIYVPSMFKCKPSLHKTFLVMLSLMTNWKLFLFHSSRNKSLTCLMILVNLNCFLMKMDDIITSLTPQDKHFFPIFIIRFTISFTSIWSTVLCVTSLDPT